MAEAVLGSRAGQDRGQSERSWTPAGFLPRDLWLSGRMRLWSSLSDAFLPLSAGAPDVAVAALALMRTPSVRLRLVGDAEDRAAVEEARDCSLGLDGRVEFSGFCSRARAGAFGRLTPG